jgi:hypothetical protein
MPYRRYASRTYRPRTTRYRNSKYRPVRRAKTIATRSKKVYKRPTLAKLSRRISSNSMKLIGPPQQMLLHVPAFYVSCAAPVSFMNENIQPGQGALYATNRTYPHPITVPDTWNLTTAQLFPAIAGANNTSATWGDTLGFRVNTRYRIATQQFQLSIQALNTCGYLDVMVFRTTSRLRNSSTTTLMWPACLSGMINLSPVPLIAAQAGIQNFLDRRYFKVLMKKRVFLNTYDSGTGHGQGRGPYFHHITWSLKQNKLITCRNDPVLATSGPEQARSYLDVPIRSQTYTIISCSGLADAANYRNVQCKLTQAVFFRDQFAEPPQAASAAEFHSAL